MVVFTAVMNGDRNVAATFGGVSIPGIDDEIDLAGFNVTQSDDRSTHKIYDLTAGGTYTVNAGCIHTWKDAAACGFGNGGLAMTVDVTGTGVNQSRFTVQNFPANTNYWIFDSFPGPISIAVNGGSDYDAVIFEGLLRATFRAGAIYNVDGCTFQDNNPANNQGGIFAYGGGVMTAFQYVKMRRMYVGANQGVFTQSFNPGNYNHILIEDVLGTDARDINCFNDRNIVFTDSSFNEDNCLPHVACVISSRNHNQVAGKMVYIMPDVAVFNPRTWLDPLLDGDDVFIHYGEFFGGGYPDNAQFMWSDPLGITIDGLHCTTNRDSDTRHEASGATPFTIAGTFDYVKLFDVLDTSYIDVDAAAAGRMLYSTFKDMGTLSVWAPDADFRLSGSRYYNSIVHVYGTDPQASKVPATGIQISANKITMDHGIFYHAQEVLTASTLTLVDSRYYFLAPSEPFEVILTATCTWNRTRSTVAAHQYKRWYIKNNGTINDIASYSDQLLPTIYDGKTGGSYYIILYDMPRSLKKTPKAKVEAIFGFMGAEGESSRILRRKSGFVDVSGRVTRETAAMWMHPLNHRAFIGMMESLYNESDRTLFQFIWPKGYYEVAELSQAPFLFDQKPGQFDEEPWLNYDFRVVERPVEV